MRRERRLTASEAALWRAVAEKVTRIEPEEPTSAAAVVPQDRQLNDAAERHVSDPSPQRAKRAAARPRPEAKPIAPRLDAGDPKLARHVARGRREIDASLDLHGLTQAQAEARLDGFIRFGAARGARTLLIVTGKGAGEARVPFAEAPRGILRERFLEWVEREPLAPLIASVRPAHQRHGGRGAFYVFLKRRRERSPAGRP